MEKFDGQQMQENFLEKTKFNIRFRSRLTKVFGMSYFKPMSEEEFVAEKDKNFQIVNGDNINNEEDIKNFLLSTQ